MWREESGWPAYVRATMEAGYDDQGRYWRRIGESWTVNVMTRADTVWKYSGDNWFKIKCRDTGVSFTQPESEEKQKELFMLFAFSPDIDTVIDR